MSPPPPPQPQPAAPAAALPPLCPVLDPPWLDCDLGAPIRVLSWALNRPGLVTARRVVWRQVRDADLTADLDARRWLRGELAARGAADAVALLTSRDVGRFALARAEVAGAVAEAVATVGLSNAEAVGQRLQHPGGAAPKSGAVPGRTPYRGTINLCLRLAPPPGASGLSDAALTEALSVAVQARTRAVIAAGIALPGGAVATGSGTDCVVVAAPPGDLDYAGLHTALGEATGAAVLAAMRRGLADWRRDAGHRLPPGAHWTAGPDLGEGE